MRGNATASCTDTAWKPDCAGAHLTGANVTGLLPSGRPSRRQYGPVGMTANGGGTFPRVGITPAGSLLDRAESGGDRFVDAHLPRHGSPLRACCVIRAFTLGPSPQTLNAPLPERHHPQAGSDRRDRTPAPTAPEKVRSSTVRASLLRRLASPQRFCEGLAHNGAVSDGSRA